MKHSVYRVVLFSTWLTWSSALQADTLFRDWIHDDYTEDQTHSIHSRAFLSYGGQTNTFNIRQLGLRYNLQEKDLQLFVTLRGDLDTHSPDINYGYLLANIGFFDYGLTFRFLKHGFVSLRGAATYREMFSTYQLLLPYTFGDPAEFDSPAQFLSTGPVGPGVRIGYADDHFELALSQGDFRHLIPMALMARYSNANWMVRALAAYHYKNPVIYDPSASTWRFQLSGAGEYPLVGLWSLGLIANLTYDTTSHFWGVLEQAVLWNKFSLGLRQVVKTSQPVLFEVSLSRNLWDRASVGVYFASDSRFYVGSQVFF